MQDAFGIVLVVVVVLAAIVAIATLGGFGRAYHQIGRGGMSLRDGSDRPVGEITPAMASGERDEEIRQMLEARNARRLRQGRDQLELLPCPVIGLDHAGDSTSRRRRRPRAVHTPTPPAGRHRTKGGSTPHEGRVGVRRRRRT